MKKIVSAVSAIIMAGTLLASCGGEKVSKEDAEVMAGRWTLVLYDYLGVKMLPEDEKTSMSMEFKDNGKVTFTFNNETEEYKWEKDEDLLTVWVPEGTVSKSRSADLDGDHFTLFWKIEETPVKLIFAREGSKDASADLYITENDVTSKMLQESNEGNILEIMEKMTPEAREAFGISEMYDKLKGGAQK